MSDEKLASDLDSELREALREHRELARTLLKIEETIEPDPAGMGAGEALNWGQGLARLLSGLKIDLERHFAVEERDTGFFEELSERFPHLSPQLERLRAEHPKIVEAVGLAAAKAITLDPEQASVARDVVCQVRLAVATLRRHESEENELIQRAYCDITGSGD